MQQLMEYLIKLSGTLIIVFLFYRLVLCRLTFHTWNRWYLLTYSLVAFFIPLVDVNPFLEKSKLAEDELVQWVPVVSVDSLTPNAGVHTSFTGGASLIIAIIVFAGILLLALRLAIRYFSLAHVRDNSNLVSDGDVRIYHIEDDVTPFSFGNAIFLNRNKHTEEELRDIIRHEFIHVKQKHTIDILFSEVLCTLNWYNPFAWLLRKAIRQNLEFIADRQVLQNGIERKKYQYLLLKVVGIQQCSIANDFNFTSLKKRIAMMNKLSSARIHLVKFLFVLPILAIVLVAFRNNQIKAPNGNEVIPDLVRTGEMPLVEIVPDTVPKPKPTSKPKQPSVVRPNEKGYLLTITEDQEEVIVLIRDRNNKFLKAVSFEEWHADAEKFESKYGKIPVPPGDIPVPPVPTEGAFLPENVASIHVKNKILTIGLKPAPVPSGVQGPVILDAEDENSRIIDAAPAPVRDSMQMRGQRDEIFVIGSSGRVTMRPEGGFNGLVIVDDKEYDIHSFNNELKLVPGHITSVEVFKDAKARQLYGEKGRAGVIKITTKNSE